MQQHEWRDARSWRRRVGVGVLAVAALVGACSSDGDGPLDDGTASAAPGDAETTTSTTIDPALIAPLTGVVGTDSAALERSALVVKIDNVEEARPQVGLAEADLVFEERVEGDVTRLVAVFHSTLPDQVGPVRSTRSTDFDLIPLFGRPVYASSGGNQGVMSGLAGVDLIDVGHNRGGTGFAREPGRRGPHNLMATPSELFGRAGDEANQAPTPIFAFRADGDDLPVGATPTAAFGVSFGGAEISRFTWDDATGTWLRSQQGSDHVDADGTRFAPVNVVALAINYTFGNGVGTSNPHGVSTGEGTAMVFTDGHLIRGTWSRPTPQDTFELVDDAGDVIALTPGQTFLELVPSAESVAVEV